MQSSCSPATRPVSRSLLAREREYLDATCEQLIAALSERQADDVTVVLVRIPVNED